MTAEVELVIGSGSDENGKAPVFEDIRGLLITPKGEIVVADSRAAVVYGFSPDGRNLWTIGRPGAGPGDLRSPCCISLNRQLLWIQESGNYRFSSFFLDQSPPRFAWTVRMPSQSTTEGNPLSVVGDGLLLYEMQEIDPATGITSSAIVYVDSSGHVGRRLPLPDPPADSVATFTVRANGGTTTYVQPFGPRKLRAVGPGGVTAEAISSRYAVSLFDASRKRTTVIQGIDRLGPALSAKEQASAERTVGAIRQRTDGRFPFGVPDRKPVISGLGFDPTGRLIVQLSVAQGQPNEADVYESSGRLSFHLTWPANVQMRYWALYPDKALGVQMDSLGTQQVVRMRIH